MGVVNYVLKGGARRTLVVGGAVTEVGVLERHWKQTETTAGRAALLDRRAADARRGGWFPKAVLAGEHLVGSAAPSSTAFLVLGWDEGRTVTQDYDWSHLPRLGYAKPGEDGVLVLHEATEGGALRPVTPERARALGLVGEDGGLARRGQPTIAACLGVSRVYREHHRAEVVLDDGRRAGVGFTADEGADVDPDWFVGKTPDEVRSYEPSAPPRP